MLIMMCQSVRLGGGGLGWWSSAGLLLRIDPRWRVELRAAVDQGDVPTRVMDQAVTRPAQKDEIPERGHAALFPTDDVVRLAPARWAPTPGATPVPGHDRTPQPVRDHPGQPPHIQRLTPPVKHDRHHRGVATQHPQARRRHGATEIQARGPGPVFQVCKRNVHVEMRAGPATLRQIAVVEDIPADIRERFGLPRRGGAAYVGIAGDAGWRQRPPRRRWHRTSQRRHSDL